MVRQYRTLDETYTKKMIELSNTVIVKKQHKHQLQKVLKEDKELKEKVSKAI